MGSTRIAALVLIGLLSIWPQAVLAADRTGLVFHVPEVLETDTVRQLAGRLEEFLNRAKRAEPGERSILILDFNPGGRPSRLTNLDACLALTRLVQAQDRTHLVTVAWIEGELAGHGVLAALACEDLVMSSRSTIGPAHEDGVELDPVYKAAYEDAARRQGRSAIVARKLVDPTTKIVRDPEARPGTDRFRDGNAFAGGDVVVEPGRPGRFDREKALELGLCLGDAPANFSRLTDQYRVARDSLATFTRLDSPVVQINLRGGINGALREKLSRDIRRALAQRPDTVVLNLECHGGTPADATGLAEVARGLVDGNGPEAPRLVAYVTPQARAGALILALACDAIVLDREAKVGFEGTGGDLQAMEQALLKALTTRQWMAPENAGALAAAMIHPEVELIAARGRAGPVRLISARPLPVDLKEEKVIKPAGTWMTLDAALASQSPLGLSGRPVKNLQEWYELHGVANRRLVVFEGSALDELAQFLSHRGTTVLLVMIGLASLMIEFMKPGLAIPGVVAAICFVLVFWAGSRMSGQIDWLAVLLFLLGVMLLLLEILVIPGFGVVGLSGVILMLCSVGLVAFGHWPRSQGEWLSYGGVVAPFGWSLLGAIFLVGLFIRFLPGIPLFSNLMLHPDRPAAEETAGTAVYHGERLQALLGRVGQTTADLRPAGTAQFDEELIDVVSDGTYIKSGTWVVVSEVEGNRVVVHQTEGPL